MVMKFLHLADLHIKNDERYLAELSAAVSEAAIKAEKEGVQLVVISGDLLDERLSLDSIGVADAISIVRRLSDVAPVVLLRGTASHDFGESLSRLAKIKTRHSVRVVSSPEIIEFEDSGEKITFYCLPGIRKKMFEPLAESLGLDMSRTTASEMVDHQIAEWGKDRVHRKGSVAMIAHLQLDIKEFPSMERGYEPAVSHERISEEIKPEIVLLGHIHEAGQFGNFFYSGSLVADSMSDAVVINVTDGTVENDNSVKGFYIHKRDDIGVWSSDFHVTSGARKYVKIVSSSVGDLERAAGYLEQLAADGNPVSARLHVKLDNANEMIIQKVLEEEKKIVESLAKRGLDIEIISPPKIHARISDTRKRVSDESAYQAMTDADKFLYWAGDKGYPISPEEEKDYTEKINSLQPGI